MKVALQIAVLVLHLPSAQFATQDSDFSIQLVTLLVLTATGWKMEQFVHYVTQNVQNVLICQLTARNVLFQELIWHTSMSMLAYQLVPIPPFLQLIPTLAQIATQSVLFARELRIAHVLNVQHQE